MSRYLVVLAWPAGLAVIVGVVLPLARWRAGDCRPAAAPRPGAAPRSGAPAALRSAAALAGLAALGAVAVFAVMCLLGVVVTRFGPGVDRPVFAWLQDHQVPAMVAVMRRLTKIGDTWTTWGAAVAAAACLAVAQRERRWLPPTALAGLIVADHYVTLALRHVFHRAGPPASPLGTFPSGGCDRCVVCYGLIAYLLWREFSGRRGTALAAAGVVAALGYNEAYSRVYLSLHWLTDALSGLCYGALLLAVFVAAIRMTAGPAPAARYRPRGAQDRLPKRAAQLSGQVR